MKDESKRMFSRLGLAALRVAVVLLTISKAGLAFAGTISVTTIKNTDSTDNACSLVEAMKAVNGNGHYKDCHVVGSTPHTVNIFPAGANSNDRRPPHPSALAAASSFGANGNGHFDLW